MMHRRFLLSLRRHPNKLFPQRQQFQKYSTNETQSRSKLIYIAPLVASGFIGSSIIFYMFFFDNEESTNISSKPTSEALPMFHRPPEPTPAEDDLQRKNWSVGEKVDRDQLKSRYAIRTSDSRKGKLQVIGRGAYGRVLSATTKGESGSTQNVAIKVVSPQQMSAQALSREVEVLRRVRGHDHVIHLLEVLECNGEWYLVTELCEGGDLLDRLINNGPYDEETCAAVAFNAASALDHVHRCGFVHCDVKPENLVFVSKGGTRRDVNADDVRLIDFGMAKDLASIQKAGGLLLRTASSVAKKPSSTVPIQQSPRVGTIAYWSPEQVIAGNAIFAPGKTEELLKTDPRACDAWALGVVMYIMLFGCHPFDIKGEGNERQIAKEIVSNPARFDIHGDRVVLSPEAREVLTGLLEPDPKKRMTLEQVMNHPFFAQHRARKFGMESTKMNSSQENAVLLSRKRTQERLPTSWRQAGFEPKRTEADDIIEDVRHAKRLAPFKTLEASQSLIQALLLAAVSTAEEDEEEFRSSDALFRAAFDALDVYNAGIITEESIEEFQRFMKQGSVESGKELARAVERASSRMSYPAPRTLELPEHYITYDEFEALLRSNLCVSRNFEKGQVIFAQCAIPQGIYLLPKGQARVEWHPPDATSKSEGMSFVEDGFATIPPGSIIGETAIVQGRLKRSATIRITEPSQVVYIPKQEFLLAVAASKALHERVFALTNQQQARRVFQLVDRLNKGKSVKFQQGQTIFKQYENADSLYLIRSGSVELTVRGQSSDREGAAQIHVRVGRRRQGDLIGVSAVNSHGKRSTTATALESVEALKIDSAELIELLREYPILKFYVESQKRWRNENWQKMLSDVEKGVSEPQILPLLGEGVEEDQGKSFEEYQKQLAKAKLQTYRAGEYVFRRGERSGELFVIESGRCDVEIQNENGKVMTITELGPGDHIGEQALLDGRPHYAFSVRCVTPVTLRALSEKQFFLLLGDRGGSNFARAVRVAMRQRRHRWVANLLNLAHENNVQTSLLNFNVDDSLFKVGDPVDRIMFIHRGSFVLTKSDGTFIRTISAGDTIGWEVFREGGALSSANVICAAKAVVEALPKESLNMLIDKHRYVSKELEQAASSIVPEFSGSNLARRRSSQGS